MVRRIVGIVFFLGVIMGIAAEDLPSLTFLGRASVKIKTASGFVVYIDPYAGNASDYKDKADLVLITHGHSDHNKLPAVDMKEACVVACPRGAVRAVPGLKTVKEGDSFAAGPVKVECVAAYNGNHDRASQTAFVVSFDGISVYHAGDTSKIPEMAALAAKNITYAMFPVDGFYNMGPAEAIECAALVKAKVSIPIHSSADGNYSEKNSKAFEGPGRMLLEPGKSIQLKPR